MFDKKLCMDNIYAIAKEKGIKIGELEKYAGLSTGYLSKLNKEGNTAVPGIDSLSLIAEKLGISIDTLISVNYKELDSNERYVSGFITKLIKGTECGKVAWEIEGGAYLNSSTTGAGFEHPLFTSMPSATVDPVSDELVSYVANEYQSRFTAISDVKSFGNSYHCELGEDGNKLYMMKLFLGDKNYPELSLEEMVELDKAGKSYISHEEIEIYLVDKFGRVRPLCSTFSARAEMKDVINKLYAAVQGNSKQVHLTAETKSIIDDFMKLKW